MKDFCINIDCIMSLINRKWLFERLFNSIIQQIKELIIVRDLKNREHVNSKYFIVSFYIQKIKFNDKIAMIHIKRDIHLINDLWAKMFINVDIIELKEMTFNLQIDKLIINNCNVITSLICRSFYNYCRINCTTNIQHAVIISTHTIVEMFFKFKNFSKLFTKRNFFFQSNSTFF